MTMLLRRYLSMPLAAPMLAILACSSSPTVTPGMDATSDAGEEMDSGAVILDTGLHPADDAAATPDSGSNADAAETPDQGVLPNMDAAVTDQGHLMGTPELVPGQRAGFVEGTVALGATFDAIKGILGPGTRTAGNTNRSYEWTLSGGAQVTVWFANTNLDNDDAPPNDVDGTDQVLWIAVTGTFAGHTPEGIGVGSTKAAVEAAYGAAPHLATLTNPAGTLGGYYTRGILVAYDPSNNARTITISKAYLHEPNGTIDIANSSVVFDRGSITAGGFLGGGTSEGDVQALLGMPDSAGDVSISGITLQLNNYAFIGLEIFYTHNGRTVLFTSVHAPFYGPTGQGTPGLSSTKTDFEAYLTGALTFHAGMQSMTQAALTCYQVDSTHKVGAVYSMDNPPTVSAILLGYPPSNGCP
ncbi:MAG: hypothetical protein U1E65_14685 [Myxococcota bacterium]